jgi:GTP 3',8-cyclase
VFSKPDSLNLPTVEDMAKGRHGQSGNGLICSRTWKEDMQPHRALDGVRRLVPDLAAGDLRDPQGRSLDYLRLAVTDRCNLRCRYCMPEDGIQLVGHDDVLSFEELHRLVALFCEQGVKRVRITGGEPLVRRGVIEFMARLSDLPSHPEILLTTNGVLLPGRLGDLYDAGVRRINLSLDSLDRDIYHQITRRDSLDRVLPLLDEIPAAGFELKVNLVVLPGINDHEIPAFAKLARDRRLQVRFIEPMPFAGGGTVTPFDGERILSCLTDDAEINFGPATHEGVADIYRAEGWAGSVGIIRGHTRTFCGTCSRLRIDTRGGLRTCLYGEAEADLRTLIRSNGSDTTILQAIRNAVARRFADGHETEHQRREINSDSMSSIGG